VIYDFTGKMVDNYMNLQAEVQRLREGIKELSEDWLRWDERGIKMAKTLMELIE
jgi:hypothetical protein